MRQKVRMNLSSTGINILKIVILQMLWKELNKFRQHFMMHKRV
ncbi:hypothetical protein SEEGA711_02109 [Salmonella enterica subsp. enterica serovar Gaminara str. ATCC BAA-711]|nr:hypothetical protein SEEGA711_02109 [Salmonella enterica subsp. enterica serovar Gaminara str. ATCC BAA-711]